MRGGRVFDLADGAIEHAAVEERWVVAAGAPLGRFNADCVLHVLDAFAIPGVVEGGEMVRGALPLFVDVGVAAFAALRLHKIRGRNLTVMQRLSGAGEEWARRSVAFVVHGGGGY